MNSQDWEHFGDEIRRTVQDAIDTQDYAKLNQKIADTVNDAVNQTAQSIRNFGESMRRPPALYESLKSAKAGSIVMAVFGYGIGAPLILVFLLVLLAGIITGGFGTGFLILIIMTGILSVIFGIMAWAGTSRLCMIKRFRTYIQVLKGREYCSIRELAEYTRRPLKTVVKDLEEMIKKGWFRQGHLDRQKSCLMVSNQAYDQYLRLEDQMRKSEEIKKQEEMRAQEETLARQARMTGLSPEVQKIIEQGDEYVRKIRRCNEAIPGEEISAKISRMEMLVDRIFDRVEQNPDSVPDIRRLMEYYLPTTVKLLEAYEELDSQPVGGENIQTAKQEIEATLDTLNGAFEKLLDDLFQDTAWDVSSDISVLHTMLAQEGLTENEFPKS